VHAELARTTRVCAYDRAAFGFSDPGPLPRDTRHLADDLAALTKAASLQPPYVLVGASLGGMIVRLYADTHLRDVGGMVLLDPEPAHEEKRLEAVSPGFTQKINAEIEQSRACLAAVEVGIPNPGSKAAADCIAHTSPNLPATVNTHWVDISSHPPFYREFLSEQAEAIGAGSDQVEASKRSYGDLPLIVLTSSTPESRNLTPTNPDPYYAARNKVVIEMHDEIARLSSRGVNRTVPGATHHMMISVPQVVIDAVNEVVAAARKEPSGARPRQ
jgi:pimeloyl-ACP methyl ester carboxylesterase